MTILPNPRASYSFNLSHALCERDFRSASFPHCQTFLSIASTPAVKSLCLWDWLGLNAPVSEYCCVIEIICWWAQISATSQASSVVKAELVGLLGFYTVRKKIRKDSKLEPCVISDLLVLLEVMNGCKEHPDVQLLQNLTRFCAKGQMTHQTACFFHFPWDS